MSETITYVECFGCEDPSHGWEATGRIVWHGPPHGGTVVYTLGYGPDKESAIKDARSRRPAGYDAQACTEEYRTRAPGPAAIRHVVP